MANKTVQLHDSDGNNLYPLPPFGIPVPVEIGGTGANSAATARINLGIIDAIYPVGSFYMSVNNTSPAALFGGTWVQIKDRFLIGAGGSYAVNATGGAATVTLTTAQMPSHGGHIYSGGSSATKYLNSSYMSSRSAESYWWIEASNEARMARTSYGSGNAHDNMPPYYAVYIWYRSA